jgi:hypothetical protein
MEMDMYFFKAGKRDDPMKGKLDSDMDDYWKSKDAAKKDEAAEATDDAPVATES